MPVQININGADAAETLKELAALSKGFISESPQQAAQPTPTAPAQQPTQAYQQQPYTPPATVPTAVPTQTSPSTVPTATAPAYAMEQLGVAATPLVDAGRGPELSAWLAQHGAGALSQLDPAFYGEFATHLRSLGAKI